MYVYLVDTETFFEYLVHCVQRAPVCEVSSCLYLFPYCLNPYNTMHFTKFRHCRNCTLGLLGRSVVFKLNSCP